MSQTPIYEDVFQEHLEVAFVEEDEEQLGRLEDMNRATQPQEA